ncbi:hypothetical protein CLAFUW4_13627 [Fulvia fulva]|uniref:non-specific serine/threonine protein kinase n=1 Tax=Passalora fulva TaxID=5499 RepID=A0A9Q8UW17_PASFU|nr:uncharacterized protein CLAFUR5_13479 [Fulvia fulva]KAK4610305.1 hypothetical protein CLAFUR4_13630 [Fulvia fulva]KAK4610930.1 hypothetical protein CLAFUR0_13634 [Fulvia fulva]UJO24548.1 hypothetical protein CLAFUR5_13479 [Fulvia fulva]WPV22303.1 hypothetical protein CLAFUW4_13627 [Fulvia fulva]WPV36730.1 hypothetical protein CLAFUW7_13635 [Fulvia fulva]
MQTGGIPRNGLMASTPWATETSLRLSITISPKKPSLCNGCLLSPYNHRRALEGIHFASIVVKTATDMLNRRWKLFMDFCSYRDLHELIVEYFVQRVDIPEPFIWYVAEQLLLAAQVLLQGGTGANTVPNWRGIIHRDTKPSNLGDFGFACETDVNDGTNNPVEFFEDEGTDGFLSPEQRRWYRRNGDFDLSARRRLREQTNVWGVGIILWSMVNLQPDGWPGIGRQNRQPPFLPGMYSASLSNFIAQCVRYNPTGTIGRPTVAQALNQIRNNPLVPGHDNFQSMETADPGVHLSRSTNPHRLQHFRPHDRYRLGLRREQMPKM